LIWSQTWVYRYNKTKRQSLWWVSKFSLRPKKVGRVCLNINVMLIIFFGYKGMVNCESVPKEQTVNKEFYLEVFRCLWELIRKKRP
jgi:hypothetical protein